MKRLSPALCAIAVATGAGILFAVPAMAQTYTPYTQTFAHASNLPVLFNNPADADYNYTAISGNAFDLPAGNVVSAGGYKDLGSGVNYAASPSPSPFTNQVDTAVGAVRSPSMVFTVAAASPSTIGYTGDTNTHNYATPTTAAYPTVSLTGQVSFNIYVASTIGAGAGTAVNTGQMLVSLEINGLNTTVSSTNPAALGMSATSPADTSDLYMVGATPSNGSNNGGTATPDGTPTGGKAVNVGATSGFQTLTFNLGSDPRTAVGSANSYGTGLGDLYGIYFTPVNPGAGQSYSVNIDNLVITAAPEPSAWLGLAAGGIMLLGLGLVSARRRRGMTAA